MGAYFLKVAWWWLLSIVKFLFAPFLMTFDPTSDWMWWEVVWITSSGAALGAFLFFHAGETIMNAWTHHFGKPKKTFTPFRRRLIRIKQRFGLKGLLAISALISVPVSSLLAAKFYRHKRETLPMMIVGFALWSVVLSTLAWGIKKLIYLV
jgi:hypothetical protein